VKQPVDDLAALDDIFVAGQEGEEVSFGLGLAFPHGKLLSCFAHVAAHALRGDIVEPALRHHRVGEIHVVERVFYDRWQFPVERLLARAKCHHRHVCAVGDCRGVDGIQQRLVCVSVVDNQGPIARLEAGVFEPMAGRIEHFNGSFLRLFLLPVRCVAGLLRL